MIFVRLRPNSKKVKCDLSLLKAEILRSNIEGKSRPGLSTLGLGQFILSMVVFTIALLQYANEIMIWRMVSFKLFIT